MYRTTRKADWQALLMHIAHLLVGSVVTNDSRTKLGLLRSMGPYAPRKEHRLRGADGDITLGCKEEQELAELNFSAMIGGTFSSMAWPIDRDKVDAAQRSTALDGVRKDIGSVPAHTALLRRYRQSSSREAIGEAGIGAEVSKLCPGIMASAFAPLHMKATFPADSQMMWRGSQLHALFNNSGSPVVITNYREVMLGDPDGKDHGAHLRSVMLPATQASTLATQYGSGLNGAGCDVPHLLAAAIAQLTDMQS